MSNKLSTQPYKGTRDFYPEDMAVQQYIFDTWSKTAELFGYAQYGASILEPSELYKSKGAENEELVNEQTYTFTDRGEREVTLRPEMTPTTARMIAGKARELSAPIRWYSIPNLFRYERPQRGRLREHWQLNCDLFGIEDISAEIEVIALAYNTLTSFGATSEMFEIKINSRQAMSAHLKAHDIVTIAGIRETTSVIDRKAKMSEEEFKKALAEVAGKDFRLPEDAPEDVLMVLERLALLGITNAIYDPSIARGFDYYTGIIFEVFDTSSKNNRSLLGGGRYDNLTELFGGKEMPGVGFGMGDVTMRDFLETHKLLPDSLTVVAPTLMIIPTDIARNIDAELLAQDFRMASVATAVDISDKRVGKKIAKASTSGVKYVLTIGDEEIATKNYTLKELTTGTETSGTREELISFIS